MNMHETFIFHIWLLTIMTYILVTTPDIPNQAVPILWVWKKSNAALPVVILLTLLRIMSFHIDIPAIFMAIPFRRQTTTTFAYWRFTYWNMRDWLAAFPMSMRFLRIPFDDIVFLEDIINSRRSDVKHARQEFGAHPSTIFKWCHVKLDEFATLFPTQFRIMIHIARFTSPSRVTGSITEAFSFLFNLIATIRAGVSHTCIIWYSNAPCQVMT